MKVKIIAKNVQRKGSNKNGYAIFFLLVGNVLKVRLTVICEAPRHQTQTTILANAKLKIIKNTKPKKHNFLNKNKNLIKTIIKNKRSHFLNFV